MGWEFYMVFFLLFFDGGDSYCVLYIVLVIMGICIVVLLLMIKIYNLDLKLG